MATRIQIVLDTPDPDSLSKFYCEALHYKIQDPPEGFSTWEDALRAWKIPEEEWNDASAIVDPEGKGPRIYFQKIYTPKLGKNRLHIDINASSGSDITKDERIKQVREEVVRITGLGAKMQKEWDEGPYGFWIVMLDPDGNEFCVQ